VTHGEQQHGGYLVGIGIAAHQRNLALAAAMRARATRTASTPADSSPMNVREDPVTP